jgi:hypothetical protein
VNGAKPLGATFTAQIPKSKIQSYEQELLSR